MVPATLPLASIIIRQPSPLVAGRAVGAWRRAHDDPAAFKHRHAPPLGQRRRAAFQIFRHLRKERHFFRGRIVIDNRGAGALQILALLKLSTSTSPFWKASGGDGRHNDGIRVLIAIIRNGGSQRRMVSRVVSRKPFGLVGMGREAKVISAVARRKYIS